MKWHTESIDVAGEEGTLYGELLLPRGDGPFPGAVLCHGMGTDHRAMRPVAQRLVRKGVATLTFDFRGHGRSDGIADENISQDVIAALKFLRSHAKVNPKRVALVGHSFGAGAAILAAVKLRDIRALVSISGPGEVKGQSGEELAALYHNVKQLGSVVLEYPRCGALPGSGGLRGFIFRLWMRVRGYRLRINWQKALQIGQRLKSAALEHMGDFPKLFVHCEGDTVAPYEGALDTYERVEPPKELLLSEGGSHSRPLLPGRLRGEWVTWLVCALTQVKEDSEGLRGKTES